MDLFTQSIHQGITMAKKPGGGDELTSGNLSLLIPWKLLVGAWQEHLFHPRVLCTESLGSAVVLSDMEEKVGHCIQWSIYFGEIGDLF